MQTKIEIKIDADNKKAIDALKKIKEIPGSKTIIIAGGVGTGKTFLAKNIFQPEYFIDEPEFKQHIVSGTAKKCPPEEWQSWNMFPIECLSRYNSIIYDDFGACEATTAYLEKMLYWMNERKKKQENPMASDYVTIFTTNLNGDEISERDARLGSRIKENAYVVHLAGKDRRKTISQENMSKIFDN